MDIKYYNDFLIEEFKKERDIFLQQINGIPMYPMNDDNLNRIRTLLIKQAVIGSVIESLRPKANDFIKANNLPFAKYPL